MSFTIHSNFPGGNILVVKRDGEQITLKPDLRESTYPWFYWYFAIEGGEGRRVTFIFEPQNIGVRGPAVSLDKGRHWHWLGSDAVSEGRFSYEVPHGIEEVRFSSGMPYVRADWDRFIGGLGESPFLSHETLTQTRSGRDVPLLLAGCQSASAPFSVALLARHHACEMMGSYVLEGMITGMLLNTPSAAWLREHVRFFVLPFVDLDGVENGDQGKNRAPHDHNRDYGGDSIYPEVRAFKERFPAWLAGRDFVGIDIHNPALSGPFHESIFFLEPEDRAQAALLDALSDSLFKVQQGSIRVANPNKLPFGSGFNNLPAASKQTCAAWMSRSPQALLAVSLEVAYANALGCEVNATSARELGRDLTAALHDWLAG